MQEDFAKFKKAFEPLTVLSAEATRRIQWNKMDGNASKKVSLAEFDGWIRKVLGLNWSSYGDTVWKAFRPSYIRSFKDAADMSEGAILLFFGRFICCLESI